MAEIVTTIVTTIAEKVAEYLFAPVGRWLSYLFCHRRWIDERNKKMEELGQARDDVQITVDEARRRGDEIRPTAQKWLDRVDEITGEAEELMQDENKSCFNGWCPNLKSRYQLSREADKKAQIIVEIQNDKNFPHGVSYRVPPRSVTFKEYESFESRASTLNKVMDALRDDKMKMIGVWGMGGVGKTTLVKQVAEQAKQEKLFTTQVYIQVSWTREPDQIQQGILDIQQNIADMLGLELGGTKLARAAKLMQRLKKEKILIILDDIWKEVNLEEVGIPSKDDEKDRKIVLASRDKDLLRRDMGAQECFPIQHLQEKEAWHLFKMTAGDSVEGDELRPIAIDVVNECEGLPIAIVTIAKALKDESVAVWKNALDELRSSAPTNIRGVEEKVYSCLEWSYNHLKGDEVKSLFLLCGSLSYGDISTDHLLRYAMGLDLFDHIKSLEQARNKLVTLVEILKGTSLLLDGERQYFGAGASRLLFMDADNESVRMHDVVRDVARNIASKDPHRFVVREDVPLEEWSEIDESKYISLNCKDVHEFPHRLVCPKLQFFLLQSNSPSLNIPDTFFEGMNLLKVLDLSKMHFTTLPSTLHSLANLRTLRLDRCELGDIALIGELKKLQVLSMAGSNIQQLPSEMGQLTNLRLFDLNYCRELKVIPRNILSRLSRLECLCMNSSFTQWAAEGVSDGESNACLSELNDLHHLTTIEIEVPAVELLPKEDMFFHNLTRYAIFIGNFRPWEIYYETSKTLKLKGADGSLLLRHGIDKLLKKTEELELRELEEVCRGPIPPRSFDNLKALYVRKCHGWEFLFLFSMARGLSQLERMTIEDCNSMQQIIAYESESEIKEDDHVGINLQLFPKLRFLELRDLPKLMNFDYFSSDLETSSQGMCSQGNLGIHIPFFSYQVLFPNLEKLKLYNLPKLKEIWHRQFSLDSFSNLQILQVTKCSGLLNLIPCHLIQSFKNLKNIKVSNCEVLKHVFDFQGLDRNVEILPKLETLKLEGLHRLKSIICNEDKNDSMRCLFSPPMLMDFQNLKHLSINDCAKEDEEEGHVNTPTQDIMLFSEKVSFPNLEELKLNGLPKLKMIWHHQLSIESFYKLRILSVRNCPCLVNLVPSYLIQSFQNLKEVDVCDCEVLERAFDHRGPNGDVGILQKLEILKFEELPRLRLIICNEDKNDNMKYLLSPSKFKDFHHLKELHIIDCGMLLVEKASFPPNLEVLVLKALPKLEEIDVGIISKFKILGLEKLPRLRHIICNEDKNASKRQLLSPSMVKNFHNLKELHIIDFGMEDGRDVYTPNDVVLSNEKPSFLDDGVSNYEAFESRASTFNNIMDALRDDHINLIGVVGTGGVGKTILVKQVAQQAKQQHLFTTQVYIDVSWTRDSYTLQQGIAQIQQKIVDMLDLPLWLLGDSIELKQTLKKKKILIILDDIWKEIDLEEVGIPCKECKVVLTCRDGDLLCKDMGAQICFPVDHLSPEEAWHLFKKTAGDSVEENLQLRPIAIQVAKECAGLPIAIVTIAKALKDESVAVWKNALDELRSSAPTNIRGVDDKVYRCLKWSYNHLKDDEVKSLFLLCGSLSYDDISMDHLLQYGMGLDLFDRIDSLEQARNRLLALLEILKASSLFMDADNKLSLLFMDADNKFVRMHDVVYDVAREIASKDPHPFVVREDLGLEEWSETDESKRCTFISLNCKVVPELPHGLVCPKLQFFLLHNNNSSLNIPKTFFEGMKNLKVLDLSKMPFSTLPSSLDSLANLRTLRLHGCKLLDIALIGKLTKLEVLSLVGSTIQQLPNEMVQLTNLRLLDLNDCQKLKVIPQNILSSLSRLECLYMNSSFTKWAVEGESNACLSELNHLSHLTTLVIQIPDVKLLPKDIVFENLTRYAIVIGDWPWRFERDCKTKRALKLNGVNIHLGDGINKLLERSEELEFWELSGTKYVLHPSDRESFLELKHLRVSSSPKIQYIIDSEDHLHFPQHGTFPLHNLEEVWHNPIPLEPFGNLKTLHVSFCDGLKFLFLPSIARGLSQLEEMKIEDCNAMQKIIEYERESEIKEDGHVGTNLQIFPKLRSLKLDYLAQLINFSSELKTTSSTSLSTIARSEGSFFNHQVSFPKLEKLELIDLPKLKDIWHHQLSFESFCNLQILRVYNCPRLLNFIPSHLIQSFQNLKKIDVRNCELLEHAVILQGIDENVEVLPKLETLNLEDLPKLRWIEDGNDSMEYISSFVTVMNIQNLKELHITNCRMENQWKM